MHSKMKERLVDNEDFLDTVVVVDDDIEELLRKVPILIRVNFIVLQVFSLTFLLFFLL